MCHTWLVAFFNGSCDCLLSNPVPTAATAPQDLFMGLVVGSLFSGLNAVAFQTTLGFLFFCMLFLSFGGT